MLPLRARKLSMAVQKPSMTLLSEWRVFLDTTNVFTLHFFTNSGAGSASKRTKNALRLANVSRKLPLSAPCHATQQKEPCQSEAASRGKLTGTGRHLEGELLQLPGRALHKHRHNACPVLCTGKSVTTHRGR